MAEKTSDGRGFMVASWGEWKGPTLYIKQGAQWVPLEILDLGYTATMPFKRGEPVVIYSVAQTENGETYVPFQSVTIPEEFRTPLIMLVADEKGRARHLVVNLDPRDFPWGSYKFVNFTASNLVGMADRTEFKLAPGKTHVVNPEKTANARFAIQVKFVNESSSEMVYSNMLVNRPSKRMILFFHTNTDPNGNSRCETRCLVDFRQDK